MRERLLYYLIVAYVLVSNLVGREIGFLPLLGRLKYLHLFLLLIIPLLLLGGLKRPPFGRTLLLFILLTSIAPLQGFFAGEALTTQYNFTLLTVFYVAAFQAFDDDKRLRTLMHVVIVSWLIVLGYKEILFQSQGVSLLFSLENLRKVGAIRQSSDTISSLALIISIYYFSKWSASKRKRLRRREVMLSGLALYVMFRYQVRAAYVATLLLLLSYFFLKPRSRIGKKLTLSVGSALIAVTVVLSLTVVLRYGGDFNAIAIGRIDAAQGVLGRSNDAQQLDGELAILYRATTWLDNLRYSLGDGFSWVRLTKEMPEIDYVYSDLFGIVAYQNPHNSYILLLQNYGLLPFLLFLLLIGRILKSAHRIMGRDAWSLFIFLALMMYAFLAAFTPIYELPYQGGVFWVLAGAGMRRFVRSQHSHLTLSGESAHRNIGLSI